MRRYRNGLYMGRLVCAWIVAGIFFSAFRGDGPAALLVARFQFGPALAALAGGFSAGALVTATVLLAGTFFFGRFYCACLCPMGILQDFLGTVVPWKRRYGLALPYLRYLLLGLALGALALGWSAGFLWGDPYSLVGRMVRSPFTWSGIGLWILLLGLSLLKNRAFCSELCPMGAMLGLVAAAGPRALKIGKNCVSCGRCAKVCAVGAVDLAGRRIDNGRCIRCMKCVAACPAGAVGWSFFSPVAESPGRRKWLMNALTVAAGVAAGGGASVADAVLSGKRETAELIPPPGAGNVALFARRCGGCNLCVSVCPAKIIVPSSPGPGPVRLDFSAGWCWDNCHACSVVCPAGALKPLSLEDKRRTKIAVAVLNPVACQVYQNDVPCGKCAAACPHGAIVLRKSGAPRPVKADLCIGCGACHAACPVTPKGLAMRPVERN